MKARHLVLLSLAAFSAVACDELVADATFDTWCGEELCHWQLEAGSIRRVETWHSGDDGVELLGSPVALSQPIDLPATQVTLRIAADLDASANVFVEIDVGDDGVLDYANVIPAGPPWSVQSVIIELERVDARTRLRLHKRGAGKARIGRLSLKTPSSGVFGGLFEGVPFACESAEACPSRVCRKEPGYQQGFCSTCGSDADCGSADYCELDPAAPLPGACKTRRAEPGCTRDEDCAEGMICGARDLNQVELSRLGPAERERLTTIGDCKEPASVPADSACREARECTSGICCTNERRPISLCVGERSRCSL